MRFFFIFIFLFFSSSSFSYDEIYAYPPTEQAAHDLADSRNISHTDRFHDVVTNLNGQPFAVTVYYYYCPTGYVGTYPSCSAPPEDPYACSENFRRITFDNNPSFCGSANSCSDIIDYALAYDYLNGFCTDSRNTSETATCGDQSILCWTSDDQSNPPVVTSMDVGPSSNPNSVGVPTVTLVESNTDDPDVTYDTVTKTVEQPDGSTVTERTTTETNNLTGQTSTSSNSVTTTSVGDMSVSIGPSSTSNEDQTEANASGGDSCSVPPSCSGDPVGCLNAKQSWLNRCQNLAEVSGDPASCSSSFQCDGDAVQCASLQFNRTQYCDDVAAANEFDQNSLHDSFTDGLSDLQNQLGSDPVGDDGILDAVTNSTETIDIADSLNLSTIFNPTSASGSCPAPYSMNLLGQSVSFEYNMFCDVLTSINPFVLMLFSFFGARILYRGLSESL
jgi:hypothetical protein